MKAVLLSISLFLAATSFAQTQIYSSRIEEFYASPTSEYFVFQVKEPCAFKNVPKDIRDQYKGGYLIYHHKKQLICWEKTRDSYMGVRDDGTMFNIPWWYVFPRRMA